MQIRFATTDDGVSIAYCEAGEGTPYLSLYPPPWSNIEVELREWEWHRIMASRRRLIRLDTRGSGSSHRGIEDYSVEALALDIAAVADAISLDRFVLSAEGQAAQMAIAYAAAHPDRVSHLIIYDGFVKSAEHFSTPQVKSLLSLLEQGAWDLYTDNMGLAEMGWEHADVARQLGVFARGCTTPDEALRFFSVARDHDVSDLLPQLCVPTLILQARGTLVPSMDVARRLAAAIPGAQLRILESPTHWSNEMEPRCSRRSTSSSAMAIGLRRARCRRTPSGLPMCGIW